MIYVYTMENCPKCQYLKAVLEELEYPFVERNTRKLEHLSFLTNRGYDHVPILMYLEDDRASHFLSKGFTKKNLEAFITLMKSGVVK